MRVTVAPDQIRSAFEVRYSGIVRAALADGLALPLTPLSSSTPLRGCAKFTEPAS